jgi:Cu-processing system permease protein
MRGGGADASAFLRIAALSWILAIVMLGVGMLISTFAHRAGAALGIAIFVWLALVFLGDLGLMGTAIATRLPVSALFASALLNPIEAFRLASLTAFSGTLDVLGPAGTYAVDRLGAALTPVLLGVLAAWVVLPALAGWVRFSRRTDL